MIKAFFLLLATVVAASAANMCVGPSATGSGTGVDWNNLLAWTATPVRGDTWYLADGTYAAKTFSTANSGTTRITINKATESNHGTSTGWTSTLGDGQAVTGEIKFTTNYWTLDGQTGGGPGQWTTGFGIKISVTGTGPALSANDNQTLATANHLIWRHIEIQGNENSGGGGSVGQDAFAIYNCDDILLSYYYAHNLGRCIWYLNGSNFIAEYGFTGIYRSTAAAHSAMAAIWSFQQGAVGDCTFRYNIFNHIEGTGGLIWDNADNTAAVLRIYGNVFYRPIGDTAWDNGGNGTIGGWFGSGGEQFHNCLVYNNVFYNINTSNTLSGIPNIFSGNIARNNLWYNCPGPDFSKFTTHTHNHFASSGGTQGESNGTSSTGDPFINAATLDFRLNANTTAGFNLGIPFNVDMLGNTRTTWTRGAVEFVVAGDPPPTLSSATINSAGTQITLVFSEAIQFGAGGSGGWALNMSGGSVTLSSPSGSGSSRTYSLSRTVSNLETGTGALSYTQPTNGIEDTVSPFNDMVSFSGGNVINNSTVQQVATPVFSLASGPYFGTQNVTITCSTPASIIRYTTDGTDPTAASTQYVAALPISATTTLKAKAFATTFIDSVISTSVYEIGTWVSSAAWKNFAAPQQTGTFTWSFRASASSATSSGLVGLSPITSTALADMAVMARFGPTGTIQARNSAAFAAVNSFTYVAGTSYDFVFNVNLAANTYSMTVAQISGSPVTIASNYAFNNTATGISELDNVGISVPAAGTVTVSQMSFGGVTSIPSLTGATVGSSGGTLTLVFSEAVSYGLGGNGGWTINATGGAATLTPTATPNSLTVSRVIAIGETGTISYTQPGNGVEASSGGGDLATLTSFAFSNQSTVDLTAPTPSPMTFSSPPSAPTSFSATMTASLATDASTPPVQYYFDETSGNAGGTDSGWQSSRTYTNNGLSPGIQYTYRVLARDSAATPNQTSPSSSVNVTTPIIAGARVITPSKTVGAGFLNP